MIRGGLGFALVSTAAFAVWALGGRWFHHHGGEAAMYATCCLVFVVLSGLVLKPALGWAGSLRTFYRFFALAFLAYAAVWCVAWFKLGTGKGEWVASLAGSLAFAAVMAAALRQWRRFLPAAVMIFIGHSAGYFAGEYVCYSSLHTTASELAWGLLYGLGFGAGIAGAMSIMPSAKSTSQVSP